MTQPSDDQVLDDEQIATLQAQHQAKMEEAAMVRARFAFLQVGGTREGFERIWPTMKQELVQQAALTDVDERRRRGDYFRVRF